MTKHVIVGAGPIGAGTARLLAERGDQVILVTRSGSGPDVPGIQRVRADASDVDALTDLAAGAAALYNCANPPYHRWATDWPPLAHALLTAAERSDAVLATVSNLAGYGRVAAPMTESTPLNAHGVKGRVRAQMWLDALAAHEAGRVRVTEIRGSDYVGPSAQSHLGDRVVPRILAGKGVRVLGSADTAHTWTYVDDVVRLLATVGIDERAWGRPWHVPSNPPRTQREAVDDLAQAAGVSPVPVTVVPPVLLRVMGLVNPTIRELSEVAYQLEQPFVMDSSAARDTFGCQPTPWPEVLTATLAHYRRVSPS
jgi:nucleoside-diphosphate-sugar epimerase